MKHIKIILFFVLSILMIPFVANAETITFPELPDNGLEKYVIIDRDTYYDDGTTGRQKILIMYENMEIFYMNYDEVFQYYGLNPSFSDYRYIGLAHKEGEPDYTYQTYNLENNEWLESGTIQTGSGKKAYSFGANTLKKDAVIETNFYHNEDIRKVNNVFVTANPLSDPSVPLDPTIPTDNTELIEQLEQSNNYLKLLTNRFEFFLLLITGFILITLFHYTRSRT